MEYRKNELDEAVVSDTLGGVLAASQAFSRLVIRSLKIQRRHLRSSLTHHVAIKRTFQRCRPGAIRVIDVKVSIGDLNFGDADDIGRSERLELDMLAAWLAPELGCPTGQKLTLCEGRPERRRLCHGN